MSLTDTSLLSAFITLLIICFIILMAWSKFEHKQIMDVVNEILAKIKENQ